MPRPSVHGGRGQEDRFETELLDAPPDLVHGTHDVVGGDHPGAEHPVWCVITEVLQPIVIGASDGCCELWFEAVAPDVIRRIEAENKQASGREEHGEVEAFGVHRVDLRLRVPTPNLGRGIDVVVVLLPTRLASVDA